MASAYIQVYVEYKKKDRNDQFKMPLGQGRHLIGTSHLCRIRVGEGHQICAYLEVGARKAFLKCIASYPAVFCDGKKLVPSEVVNLGDALTIEIMRQKIFFKIEMNDKAFIHGPAVVTTSQSREAEKARIKSELIHEILHQLNLEQITLAEVDSPELRNLVRLKLAKLVADYPLPEDLVDESEDIEQSVYHEVVGLGSLEPLLADESITEIMVNSADEIYMEREGKVQRVGMRFSSNQALLNIIERIVSSVGRRIDQSCPLVDARLLDGSRVNAVIPPLSLKGPSLTIRRFPVQPLQAYDLIERGTLSASMVNFLKILVEEKVNLIISGGTGTGKTTLLNILSRFIPDNERIITVEDAAELQLQQEHVVSLETRPANLEGRGAITIRDLVRNTLRMRPDRIIVGECRGAEAIDMLQAMNTGHDGSMTTAHANSCADLLRRLETMVLMAGMDLPLHAIREQVAAAVDIIIQLKRFKCGARKIVSITQLAGLNEQRGYQLIQLFYYDAAKGFMENKQACQEFWNLKEYKQESYETASITC